MGGERNGQGHVQDDKHEIVSIRRAIDPMFNREPIKTDQECSIPHGSPLSQVYGRLL